MAFASTRDYLYALRNTGSRFGIERMQRLAEALNQPQRDYPVIHVAGTNGKGSVCALLESIYRAQGLRVGLSTSPHLVHLGERIQIDRQPISEADICNYVATLQPIAAELAREDPQLHPTFFEFLTAMAFLYFQRERVDLAVIETGLGGRLDASNVVDPEVAVITSIALDHEAILGNTLEKIAAEKGGIIKPGKPVVIGLLPACAEAVLRDIAGDRGSTFHSIRERFPALESAQNLSDADVSTLPQCGLFGTYQRINAATATLVTEVLSASLPVSAAALQLGLAEAKLAGRWQALALSKQRTLIVDAAHNAEGVLALEQNLQSLPTKPVIVTGVLGQSRAEMLLPVLCRHAKALIVTQPQQPRACSAAELRALVPTNAEINVTAVPTVAGLFADGQWQPGDTGDTIVVAGSLYLIGEIMEQLEGLQADNALQDRF